MYAHIKRWLKRWIHNRRLTPETITKMHQNRVYEANKDRNLVDHHLDHWGM